MSLSTIIQHCLTGVSLGGAYALIAIGYTMVYGILLLINFAHGDIFMMAGYFMIFAMVSLPWYIAIPVTLLGTVILGVVIEKVAYKPLRSAPRMSIMISAIGISSPEPCYISFHGSSQGLSRDTRSQKDISVWRRIGVTCYIHNTYCNNSSCSHSYAAH